MESETYIAVASLNELRIGIGVALTTLVVMGGVFVRIGRLLNAFDVLNERVGKLSELLEHTEKKVACHDRQIAVLETKLEVECET